MAMTFQQQLEEALKRQQPVFRPTYEGLLSRPTSQITTPETFQPGLLNQPSVGKQLGLLGLSFAPGAGLSDYAGTFPSAQGGVEPGFEQNVREGNYLTAGLQGLGAFGDMATATGAALGPLGLAAGMGVGSIAKAPRAVQKGVEGLLDTVRPKIDDLGFFSQVEKSVMDIPQQKGTGQQFLAQIQKTPGVKPEEIQYTGLDKFLADKPTVTKGEIQDYLDANRVQVKEVQLGVPDQAQITNQLTGDIRDILEAGQVFDDDAANFLERYQSARLAGRRDSQSEASLEEYLRNAGDNRTISEIEDVSREMAGDTTKFSQYTLPGGTNYREVLLTLPRNNRNPAYDAQKALEEANIAYDADRSYENYQRVLQAREEVNKIGADWSSPDYRSSHFDQPNILAHMRVNDRTIDGKPTLFIEEIQSDWHQAGRKQGYATGETKRLSGTVEQQSPNEFQVTWEDGTFSGGYGSREAAEEVAARGKSNAKTGVPDAPFKSTWDELTLKRAIKMASDEGYDQIAFTTGKTQADRYALSRSVDSIDVRGFGDNRRIVQINGKEGRPFQLQVNDDGIVEASMYARQFEGKPLDEVVGKDVAKQLMDAKESTTLSGLDLDVGGEGMKGFYDKMLPKKLEKIGKKYGAKVTKMKMAQGEYNPLTKKYYQDGYRVDPDTEVWVMEIPKEMRETVKEQGQPLFQVGAGLGLGTGGLLGLQEEEQY